MEENEGKNLAAEKKIQKFEKELKELISQINEEKSRIVCGNVAMNVEKRDGKFECFIGAHKIITCKDGEVSYNVQELEQLYKEIEKANNEDRPIPDLLESMGLPKLDDLKDYEEKRKNEEQRNGANQNKKEEPEKAEEQEEPEKDEDENSKDNLEGINRNNLKKINRSVLVLINPSLREYKDGYLYGDKLIFEDKEGKFHTAEECGFEQKKSETGNFDISDVSREGAGDKNPTIIYAVKGERAGVNYGIAIDVGESHTTQVSVVAKNRGHNHINDWVKIGGNITQADTGDISKYQAQEVLNTREGWNGAIEAVADILEKDKGETRENAVKKATKMIEEDKTYEEVTSEMERDEEDPRLVRGHDARNW